MALCRVTMKHTVSWLYVASTVQERPMVKPATHSPCRRVLTDVKIAPRYSSLSLWMAVVDLGYFKTKPSVAEWVQPHTSTVTSGLCGSKRCSRPLSMNLLLRRARRSVGNTSHFVTVERDHFEKRMVSKLGARGLWKHTCSTIAPANTAFRRAAHPSKHSAAQDRSVSPGPERTPKTARLSRACEERSPVTALDSGCS